MKKTVALFMAAVMAFLMLTVSTAEGAGGYNGFAGAAAETELPNAIGFNSLIDDESLNAALNAPGGTLSFMTLDPYSWYVADDYARSGNNGIKASYSAISTIVNVEPNKILTFDFRCFGDGNYNSVFSGLQLFVDSTMIAQWSYADAWTCYQTALPEGEHTITWLYRKNLSSTMPINDYACLKNISINDPILPESVSFARESVSVQGNRSIQLEWEVLPEDAFNKNVTFQSSNETVATVDENGYVRGLTEGETEITIATIDGNRTDSCIVTVTEPAPIVNLYGFFAYDNNGYDYCWGAFPDNEPTNFEYLFYMDDYETYAAAYVGGTIYGYITFGNFYTIDPETWEYELYDYSTDTLLVISMAYNHSTDTMYALAGNGADVALYTCDLTTGELTFVASIDNNIYTLAISIDGAAYGLSGSDMSTMNPSSTLYSIDLENGSTTSIGRTGYGLQYVQSMCFDYNTNQLYWAQYFDSDNNGLLLVDTETAECTRLGTINGGAEICGLLTIDDIAVNIGDVTTAPVDTVSVDAGARDMNSYMTDPHDKAEGLADALPFSFVDDAALNAALNAEGSELSFISLDPYSWGVDGEHGKSANKGKGDSFSAVSTIVNVSHGMNVQFDFMSFGEESLSNFTVFDGLQLFIDNTLVKEWGRVEQWTTFRAAIPEGTHTLTWIYKKDSTGSLSGDYACIDNIVVKEIALPEAVEFATDTITVNGEAYIQLEWEVLPETALNKSVSFESTDEGIVLVDALGRIRGISEGTATITIATEQGGFTDTCLVTVAEAAPLVDIYGFTVFSLGANAGTWGSVPDFIPKNYTPTSTMGENVTYAAAFAGGTVYGYLTDGTFFTMDPLTWEFELRDYVVQELSVIEMAYDHSTDTMYALATGGGRAALYTSDLSTGELSYVCALNASGSIFTLAISTDGIAYGLAFSGMVPGNESSMLYTIELETGVCTPVGRTGYGLEYVQSMCYDHNTNRIYWAQWMSNDLNGLVVIDPETGAGEMLGKFGAGQEICGLFTLNDIEISHPHQYIQGDANGDHLLTVTDALLIMRHAMGLASIADEFLLYCDMDGDEIISSTDALLLLRSILSA